MRDKFKDSLYFKEYIEEEERRLIKFSTKLNNNEVKEDRIIPVKKKMDAIRFGIFVAKYSSGEELENIKSDFIEMIYDMPQVWNPSSGYIDMLWMISIALMYEIDEEPWNILIELVGYNHMSDWLIEFLISFRNSSIRINNEIFRMEDPYKNIKDIVDNTEDRVQKIKIYLNEKWYNAHLEMGWYDIHKNKEKLYYGYWSFETGALVKILGLDDSELRGVQYYPYDLVHYKK